MSFTANKMRFILIFMSFMMVFSILFLGTISLVKARAQVIQGASFLRVELYTHAISGIGFTPDSTVTLEAYDGYPGGDLIFGPLPIQTDSVGFFAIDDDLYFQPGYFLQLEDSTAGITRELVLADLSFRWLNPATDVITGTAPAGEGVMVTIQDDPVGYSLPIAAGLDGVWVADFSGLFDLDYSQWVDVVWSDPDGDQTVLVSRGGARIHAGVFSPDLNLSAFTPNGGVQLEVYDDGENGPLVYGPEVVTIGPDGNYNGNGLINLVQGDFIRAVDLTYNYTKELTLNLEITEINTATDVVTGTTFENGSVAVYADDDGDRQRVYVDADSNGDWTADFSGVYDILPESMMAADSTDSDGDVVHYEGFGDPYFQAFSYVNYVGFYSFYPDEMLSFKVVDTVGATLFWSDTLLADRTGWFWIGEGDNVPILPGYILTAVDLTRDITVTLEVDELMVQQVDYAADFVEGYGPPLTEIRLQVGPPHYDITSTVTGSWEVDLQDAYGFDLPDGQWVFASVIHRDEGTSTTYVWYDDDVDGVDDRLDNAPEAYNPDQSDIDEDGVGDVSDPCPSDPEDQCDPSGSVSVSIGEDGGTVETDNGSTNLAIPADAISEETSISITDIGSGYELTTDVGELEAVFGVELGPPGLTFTHPVTITFHWDDADQDGFVDGTGINEDNLVVIKDGLKLTDYCREDPDCDKDNNVFVFQVSSFSQFAIAGEIFDVFLPLVAR